MSPPRARFLHVANGTCTTNAIEAAGIPGLRSIWADPLHDGPVPADLSDDELCEVRRRHLSGEHDHPSSAWAGPDPAADPVNDFRTWRTAIRRHESYAELVLWFEHDLFDQLNLIQLLSWIHAHLPPDVPVSLIGLGAFPERPDFKGVAELTGDELAALFAARQPVDARRYALAARAWQAFRAPTPEPLDALRHDDTSALPYMAAALGRFLQEYPWTGHGLSRTERRLLELAAGEGLALSAALPRLHEGERVYYVTDTALAALAGELARLVPPLLVLDLARPAHATPLRGVVTLTETGRRVLSGGLDRINACGIDRWLGGVRLAGHGRVWRWDDARQQVVLTEPPPRAGTPADAA